MLVDIIIRDKLRPVPKHGSNYIISMALRPRKPEGSLGRTAQDGHLDSHTAPELWHVIKGFDDDVGLHVLGCRVDIKGFALKFQVDLIVSLENTGCVTICSEIGLHVRDTL